MTDFLDLKTIAKVIGISCDSNLMLTGVSIDSRTIKPGALFIALSGKNYDGHDFIYEAINKGAAAVLSSKLLPEIKNVVQLVVANPFAAMVDLAKYYRNLSKAKIIALTGSNGKTSVKNMIANILPKPSHATLGNLNNHIGVPLNILSMPLDTQYAVFELGANHLGEIATNVAIVKPHVALINNISPAHIGEFGSLNNIAIAKGEIYEGLDKTGIAIVNEDGDYAHFWDEILKDKKVFRYSLDKNTDFFVSDIQYNHLECASFLLHTKNAHIAISLKVPGRHNIANALAAAACTYVIGIPLENISLGLNSFSGVAGRMTYLQGINNITVIDDSYNANLESALAALEILKNQKGKKIFVFGDMGELGAYDREHHEKVGLYAKKYNIDKLFTCGKNSAYAAKIYGAKAQHFLNHELLIEELLKEIEKDSVVLVKGSRASHMEKVVQALTAN